MSLSAPPTRGVILLGEIAILADAYPQPDSLVAFQVSSSATVQARSGAFRHDALLGRAYGSEATPTGGSSSDGTRPHVLRLTPELWTLSLPHRTQILYATDIAFTVMSLSLRPGATVVESGTGSGSLTHALARAVAPHGAVHSFDFNAARVSIARSEFAAHALGAIVRCEHRDVVADGFLVRPGGAGGGGVEPHSVDGVFLDVPNPWVAVRHASAALAAGGVLVSFSPCIEQVQRTALAMVDAGFEDVRTYETLRRPWEFSAARALRQPVITLPSDVGVETAAAVGGGMEESAGGVVDEDGGNGGGGAGGATEWSAKRHGKAGSKRARSEPAPHAESRGTAGAGGATAAVSIATAPDAAETATAAGPAVVPWPSTLPKMTQNAVRVIPRNHARGHTGYLTVATLYRKGGGVS